MSYFSATFVFLQPFSTALARRASPKYWIPFLMISWGAVSMAHAAIKNRASLIALRLLLGAFEAGFVPSCFYYLGTLYPHYMLGFRLGLFAGMFSIAAAFSSLIAYAIFHIEGTSYQDWQLLFLIEGGATIVMAFISLMVLPDKLTSAWFLTKAERDHGVRRMNIDNPTLDEDGNVIEDNHKITKRDVKDALMDYKKLLTIVCNICAVLPVVSFSFFMPIIVRGMGYDGIKANLMSASPFVVYVTVSSSPNKC
jgi:MFS family permease